MHILLNTESIRYPMTGIGHYTWHLLSQLRRRPDVTQIDCLNLTGVSQGPQTIPTSGTKRWHDGMRHWVRGLPGAYALVQWFRDQQMQKISCNPQNTLYFEPNFILRPYQGRSVVMVHDLSHIHYPAYHPRERVWFLNRRLPQSLAKASHILTSSDFIREEVLTQFDVSPEKVTRIYHGVSPVFHPRPAEALLPIKARYGLEGSYILTVATLEPRKNFERLLEAYHQLPLTLQRQFPLVIVGNMGWKHSGIERRMAPLLRQGVVKLLGYVPDADLPALYAGATVFAYLSVYEGFGLPVLEAMASGVPVLASNRSSIPEVMGTTGRMVDPEDIEQITAALTQLLTDPVQRTQCANAALERARQFTWERCCAETMAVFASVQKS